MSRAIWLHNWRVARLCGWKLRAGVPIFGTTELYRALECLCARESL